MARGRKSSASGDEEDRKALLTNEQAQPINASVSRYQNASPSQDVGTRGGAKADFNVATSEHSAESDMVRGGA